MKAEQIILLVMLCGISIFMLVFYLKQKHPVKSVLFGSLSGLISLLAAKGILVLFGIMLPLNLFSVCFSAVLGVPGAAVLSILQLFA